MKVLIADDEFLVRSSLVSMLKESGLPVDIAGEAVNGEEMVGLARNTNPDIAFVDIRMPVLNGLEAIKAAKDFSPNTQWIILTGFSEFDYAKEAIRLGAANYLLKPVSPEELQEVLLSCMKRNMENNIILNKEFENELIAMNHELAPIPAESELSHIGKVKFTCAVFTFDSCLDEKAKAKLQLEYCNSVRSAINEAVTLDTRIALFPMASGELALAGAWGIKREEQGKEVVRRLFDCIRKTARRFNRDEFFITIFQSDECDSFVTLHKKLAQLQNLSLLRAVMNKGTACSGNDLERFGREASPGLLKLSSDIARLASAYKDKDYLGYMQTLGDIEKDLGGSGVFGDCTVKSGVNEFLLHSICCSLENRLTVREWTKVLKSHGEHLLEETRKEESNTSDITKRVISYIERNYMSDISIGQIAEQLDITPNYLSTLFHRKMGTTFMKHLTGVRMLKAKELLSSPNAQVQQVAEKVGYYSIRHFTRLFKEFYGFYPSEYRDKPVK